MSRRRPRCAGRCAVRPLCFASVGRYAQSLAQELSHPLSLAIALHFTATMHQFRREAPAAQEWAAAATVLSREQGLPFWDGSGTIMGGWALAAQGRVEAGMAQIHRGLVTFRATGAEVQQPSWLALLAETCWWAGQAAHGLNAVAEALAIMDKTGERYYEAELYRLKGELLLQESAGQKAWEAEASFLQALDVAVHPDTAEGRALMAYLRAASISFIAFRSAVPGAATGAHIHIGPASHRVAHAGSEPR